MSSTEALRNWAPLQAWERTSLMSALLRSCRDATRRSTSAGVMPGAVCRAWRPSFLVEIRVLSASGQSTICRVLPAADGKHRGHSRFVDW